MGPVRDSQVGVIVQFRQNVSFLVTLDVEICPPLRPTCPSPSRSSALVPRATTTPLPPVRLREPVSAADGAGGDAASTTSLLPIYITPHPLRWVHRGSLGGVGSLLLSYPSFPTHVNSELLT